MTSSDQPPRHCLGADVDLCPLAQGPLYYYVGAGLSTGSGLVSWPELAGSIWRYLHGYEGKSGPAVRKFGSAAANETFLDQFVKERNSCGHPILSRQSGESAPPDQRAFGRTIVLNMLLRYRAPGAVAPGPSGNREPGDDLLKTQSLLWESRCRGILTSNYDLLLERAFHRFDHHGALRSYRYTADFLRFVLSNPRFVLHLHGDIDDIATMEFNPTRAWSRGCLSKRRGRGDDLKRVYCAALETGHMIYLGCGFRDATIRSLHKSWMARKADSRLSRLALVPEAEVRSGEIRPERLPGIEFLTWRRPEELKEFLKKVVKRRTNVRLEAPSEEAKVLYEQLFLAGPSKALIQRLQTQPWTCERV